MRRFRAGFTTRARCLLAGGVTAAVCGVAFGEVDLVRAGVLVAAIPVVASFVVNRSQVTIASRRGADPARAAVGQDVAVQLTITNRSVLPTGALMLEDRLPDGFAGRARFGLDGLNRRESRTVAYRIPSLRRGRYVAGPLRVRLTDPFGLIDATRSFTATSTIVITPPVEALPHAILPNSWDVGENAGSHSIGSHGADDASTREYRHGDDLRKIHWRSTARTGALMVRHEERPWQGHTSVLLDLRANGHESWTPPPGTPPRDARAQSSLEWAVSCAASIANHLYLQGREVSLVAESAGRQRVRFPSQAGLVDHLADARPGRHPSLQPLEGALRAAARDSTIVAVLGALNEVSVQVLADAHPRGSGTPAFAILLDTASWRGAPDDLPGYERDTLDRQIQLLRGAGWWAVAADSTDTIPAAWSRLLADRGHSGTAWGASARVGRRS